MAVLYRKYRPQTFSEVLSQKHIVETLKNQVATGQVAHAYLFTGSRGVGKTSFARILAKAVNCLKAKKGEPDGTCDMCKAISQNSFLDLVEIDAASNTGVDNIRDLIEHVKFSPSVGKYKVFIIDEVHMLSKGAFNALLKTLEEPPAHAIFILATTEIQKVPATVVSRTQRFDFKSYSVSDLAAHLEFIAKQEKVKVSKDILELVASSAQGSVRDCLSLFDKVLTLGSDPKLSDCQQLLGVTDTALSEGLLSVLATEDASKVPDFFSSLLERGTDLAVFNKDFLEYLRKALIFKAAGQLEGLSEQRAETLQELAAKLSVAELIFIVRLFLKSYKDLPSSPSQDLPLLLASLEACQRKQEGAKTPTPSAAAVHAPAPAGQAQAAQAPVVSQFAFTHILEPTTAVPSVAAIPLEASLDTEVSFLDIENHWVKVLGELKDINGPLANLLKNSPLIKVEQGRVVVGVKFLFHKQNLENQKNLKVIHDILHKVTGKRLGLVAHIVKDEAAAPTAPTEMLNDALRIFGGEVVE